MDDVTIEVLAASWVAESGGIAQSSLLFIPFSRTFETVEESGHTIGALSYLTVVTRGKTQEDGHHVIFQDVRKQPALYHASEAETILFHASCYAPNR